MAAQFSDAAVRGVERDQRRMEALAGSSSMRAGMRVLLDEAVKRGLNFVFAGAVIGAPASLG